ECLAADPTLSAENRFSLLEEAAQLDPNNRDVLQRLVVFTRETGPQAEKSRRIFRGLIDRDEPSALAHVVLGSDAWMQNKPDDARYHWDKAFRLSGGDPTVGNNLAWILAHNKPVDLEQALAIINEVVKRQNNPKF